MLIYAGHVSVKSLEMAASSQLDDSCPLLLPVEDDQLPKEEQLRSQLESKEDEVKIEALKTIIGYLLRGN